MRLSLIAGLLSLALLTPAIAQDEACISVEHDKELAESRGLEYLGTHKLPFTNEESVFYVHQGAVWVSPIFEGCVAKTMYRAGEYVPQRNA